jgi:hypothetical protein
MIFLNQIKFLFTIRGFPDQLLKNMCEFRKGRGHKNIDVTLYGETFALLSVE